ncbi:hypothetical protein SAMN06296058_3592 [Pseudoxanthomonas indica]|uniref:Uncharacterized protein n=2 Tax=Pseudoxanthomonas indica TaxID=428993 RepID=A0A1T5M2N5_9GAMM|nr:hypothetical protein GCM10007235_35610 [Pseudoxanthomonas indica]SKC82038.1 hypothetical protein SAMN06296058_3592 [Pseudoxanthomonas indica]
MEWTMGKSISACALMLGAPLAQQAAAQDVDAANSSPAKNGFGDEWVPVDPARLDEMRGGFELPSGQVLSFGIERAVYVNGELLASNTLRISDLSKVSAADVKAMTEFNKGLVVQIGDNNTFEPAKVPGAVVIQNTLDNQHIVSITRMDIGSNVLSSFQEMNASNALHDSLINAASYY